MTTPAPCVADLPSMDAVVPCDEDDCAAPATHRVVLHPCLHGGPMCLAHATDEVSEIAAGLRMGHECCCLQCDATLEGADTLAL